LTRRLPLFRAAWPTRRGHDRCLRCGRSDRPHMARGYCTSCYSTVRYRAIELLAPACERIQIAGSIRRRKETVKDVEIVLIPKTEPTGMFGDGPPASLQFQLVQEWASVGVFRHRLDKNGRPACGPRFQRLIFEGMPLDVFCVLPPAQWGLILAIRTGPWEFSKRMMTPKHLGGMLPMGCKVQDGQLWDRQQPIPLPEEEDVFRHLGMDWIEPEARA
jgi:DNA polymerase/3'-5' exonuclease PolX